MNEPTYIKDVRKLQTRCDDPVVPVVDVEVVDPDWLRRAR